MKGDQLQRAIAYFLMPSSGNLVTNHEGLRRAVELLSDASEEITRLTAEIAALRDELDSITHVAVTTDPAGWWISPRGSTDPTEWIFVDEIWPTPQCQECGRDNVEAQWVCEHCGHRADIDGARNTNPDDQEGGA